MESVELWLGELGWGVVVGGLGLKGLGKLESEGLGLEVWDNCGWKGWDWVSWGRESYDWGSWGGGLGELRLGNWGWGVGGIGVRGIEVRKVGVGGIGRVINPPDPNSS